MYSAKKLSNGNYEIYKDGQRISTGTASVLSRYGLSETNLGNAPAPASTPAPAPASAPTPTEAANYAQMYPTEQVKVKPPIPQNFYDQARAAVLNGSMNPQQAKDSLQGLISSGLYSGSVNIGVLFPPGQTFQKADGSSVQFDNTGSGNTITVARPTQQTTVSPTGITTSQTPQSPLNQGMTPEQQSMYNSLPNELKTAYQSALQMLERTIASGNVVNPQIQLTPAEVARFMDQASTELDPYFREAIAMHKQDLTTSLQRLQQDYTTGVNRSKDSFAQAMQDQDEDEAQSGTVYSSGRQDRERRLIAGQQYALDDAATEASRFAEDAARSAERTIGSSALGSVSMPGIATYTAGRGTINQTGTRSLYTPQGNLLGSLPKEQETARRLRASELEASYRGGRSLSLSSLN